MQLIAILLVIVSILTLLSGIVTFFGTTKGDRIRSAWFLVATIFAAIWMINIALFYSATPSWSGEMMTHCINLTYLSAVFIDIALLGYIAWRSKAGRATTIFFLIAGSIFAIAFVANHDLLYTKINLTNSGNSLDTNVGPFYYTYTAFFCALVPAVLITLLRQIVRSKSDRIKNGNLVLLIGFAISGTVSLVFNLILPFWTWSLIWLGPLAISVTIIAFYYTILRYHSLRLNSRWLKILSYVVLITSVAVIYMTVFYLVFLAMFRGSSPSLEVITLNFVMVLFFLFLMPAINEAMVFIRSLISGDSEEDYKTTK